MKICMQMIILIAFLLTISIEANTMFSYTKNYARKVKKGIKNYCNKFALNKTNNYDIFNCLNNNMNCNKLKNYDEYIIFRDNCITNYNNNYAMSSLFVLSGFLFIGLLNN